MHEKIQCSTCVWNLPGLDVALQHVIDLWQHVRDASGQDDATSKAAEGGEQEVGTPAVALALHSQAAELEQHWREAHQDGGQSEYGCGNHLRCQDIHYGCHWCLLAMNRNLETFTWYTAKVLLIEN